MRIEKKKKTETVPTYYEVKVGDVFTFVDLYASCSKNMFLMCDNCVVDLENYRTIGYHDIWEWFIDEEHFTNEEDSNFFIDSFSRNIVKIYNATLTIETN